MKSIALLLTIVFTIAVNSQAQTVQKKNYFLNSHVIKGQNDLTAKKIKKDNRLADSLTIEEKLMMMPLRNNLYDKINTPFNTAKTKYLLKHKLLFRTINAAVETWYTNKYDIDNFGYKWFHRGLQQSLNRPLPINPGNGTLFRPINNRWIQF